MEATPVVDPVLGDPSELISIATDHVPPIPLGDTNNPLPPPPPQQEEEVVAQATTTTDLPADPPVDTPVDKPADTPPVVAPPAPSSTTPSVPPKPPCTARKTSAKRHRDAASSKKHLQEVKKTKEAIQDKNKRAKIATESTGDSEEKKDDIVEKSNGETKDQGSGEDSIELKQTKTTQTEKPKVDIDSTFVLPEEAAARKKETLKQSSEPEIIAIHTIDESENDKDDKKRKKPKKEVEPAKKSLRIEKEVKSTEDKKGEDKKEDKKETPKQETPKKEIPKKETPKKDSKKEEKKDTKKETPKKEEEKKEVKKEASKATPKKTPKSAPKSTITRDNLPEGWTVKGIPRKSSSHIDYYYTGPSGQRCRSIVEVQRAVDAMNQ